MAGRLDGKVCVITGAGGGMGRDAAILFTEEGAKVCAADVEPRDRGGDGEPLLRRGVRVQGERGRGGRRRRRCTPRPPSASAASTCSTTTPASRRRTTRPCSTRRVEAWDRVQAVNTKRRLPLLQARDPVPARARRRLGDQRRLVRRDPRRGDLADLVHGLEGRRPLDEPRARGAVRPRRASASTRSARGRSRRRCCSTSSAATRRRSSGGGSTGRRAGWRSRARSSTARSSSRATSRRTSTARRSSSTAA